ncbi:MAG: TetR/AcrR family transcriptional regulator [Ignavibacteriae bacterium]|nr:TetR/AcrR family transcriptional regulator [Ignavibacteriota bacterium]
MAEQEDVSSAKNRIIEYAMPLFSQSGFSRVSVEEITSALGMSKKTFYKYFESKEDLVHQIVLRITGEIGLQIDSIVTTDHPFVLKLNALISVLHTRFSKFSTPMLRDVQIHAPGTWAYIQEFRRTKIIAVWGRLIEQGQREGFIRPAIDPRLLLLSIIGVVESVVNPQTLANESFSTEQAMKGIIDMLFRGILTDAAVREIESLHVTQLL